MVSIADAIEAIEDKLKSEWTAHPVVFENQAIPELKDSDGEPAPFAYCEMLMSGSQIIGSGTPGQQTTREDGEIEVTVFVPINTGRSSAREYAVEIGEIFRNQKFFDVDPTAYIRTMVPELQSSEKSTSENPNGNWWSVSVAIPFEFYHLT